MFQINGLERGNCDAAESHVDREVVAVQDLLTKQLLCFCPKCLIAQIRLRSKGRKPDPRVATQAS